MGRDLADTVTAAAAGDQAAVKQLVEAVQNRLYKFCLVLYGDPSRAEDLSQEALLKALGSLNKLKQPAAFMDWLFRMTRNIYIDEVRRRRREDPTENEILDQHAAHTPEVADILAVHRVLSHFEAEDRWLLVLVDMEDYSYGAAAEVLGISESAVKSRLFRLRKEFVEKWNARATK